MTENDFIKMVRKEAKNSGLNILLMTDNNVCVDSKHCKPISKVWRFLQNERSK